LLSVSWFPAALAGISTGKEIIFGDMSRSSTNDAGGIINKYLHPIYYQAVALERLQRDRGLLGPKYRALLLRQAEECQKEIEKKAKQDVILWK